VTASPPETERGIVALIRDAAHRFDASPELQAAARASAGRGFQGGAEWMALALARLRGGDAGVPGAGALKAGLLKYGAAAGAGILCGLALGQIHWVAGAVGSVLAFYAVEAQGVFVFPALAGGAASPWRESRALVTSVGGTPAVVARALVLALVMLLGGFAGRGFLRSWCVGCLAVVLWYEELRR
jgi:hypothetical protein